MKDQSKVNQGKRNKARGRAFEANVRKDLEKSGWTVAKWSNNVSEPYQSDIGEWVRKIIPAKHKFNFFSKVMSLGTGFPDFIAFRKVGGLYEVIGVEAKGGNDNNKYLDKEEKYKVEWLLNKRIFNYILLAQRGEKRGQIDYTKLQAGYDAKT